MIRYNRLLFASIVLILIFAMPGMPNLMKIYATPSISDLLGNYFDGLPFSNDSNPPSDPVPTQVPTPTQDPTLTPISQPLIAFDKLKALNFIKSMYESKDSLVKECPSCIKKWLWSDQLLAQIMLKHVDPAMATAVETKMNSFNIPMRNPWATLDPDYRNKFSVGGTTERQVGSSNVWYSDYSGRELSCARYADVAFLKTIHLFYLEDKAGAQTCYNAGKAMWDGKGMKDAGQITGEYAVYKTALGLLAEKITGFSSIGIPANYFDRFQAANGGVTTDLTGGQPQGSQNVETTFAVLAALDPSLLLPPSTFPSPTPDPTPDPTPTPDPVSECSESKISRVVASGYGDGKVPQNTVDKNYNTRWANHGIGSYIQYEVEPNKIICAIDIAWHRGDVRTSDFTVSSSNDGSNFVSVFSSKSSGKTNLYERYVIQDSNLQAKHIRITVNGNTENPWAAITEVRMLSKPLSTTPTPDPTPDPTPTPIPPQSDRDVFNVTKIYRDKPNGEKWFMNMANPASDPRFDPKVSLKKNSDGSWKVTTSQARMNVFTSTGYDQNSIQTYNQKEMASKGFMQSPNDWKDVEITGYVKINSAPSDLDLSWYGRGGKHNADVPCEGTSIKGSIFVDGKTRFAKEQWHPGGYSFTPSQKPVSSLMDKWIGFKTVMYNVEIDGKIAVKMENWIDINNDGNWKKIYGYTDSGGLGSDGSRCGGSADQTISWGGPILTLRWDGTSNVDIKNFSVREISTG